METDEQWRMRSARMLISISSFSLIDWISSFFSDSVRAWKKKLLAQNAGGQESTAAAGDEAKESAAEDIKVHILGYTFCLFPFRWLYEITIVIEHVFKVGVDLFALQTERNSLSVKFFPTVLLKTNSFEGTKRHGFSCGPVFAFREGRDAVHLPFNSCAVAQFIFYHVRSVSSSSVSR